MVIPSDLAHIPRVHEVVLKAIDAAGYSSDARFAVRLAIDEALTNAIRHGNQQDPAKHVAVEYSVTPKQVTIRVRDEGPGFDFGHLPDPTTKENLTRPHGRGILLIRAYMTEADFSEKGRCLTMVKRRDCDKPRM